MFRKTLLLAVLAVASLTTVPALADHYHYRHHRGHGCYSRPSYSYYHHHYYGPSRSIYPTRSYRPSPRYYGHSYSPYRGSGFSLYFGF